MTEQRICDIKIVLNALHSGKIPVVKMVKNARAVPLRMLGTPERT